MPVGARLPLHGAVVAVLNTVIFPRAAQKSTPSRKQRAIKSSFSHHHHDYQPPPLPSQHDDHHGHEQSGGGVGGGSDLVFSGDYAVWSSL